MADEKNMFVDMEHEVMDFWEKEKCFEKLREKNRGHKMFRFLDGPITANNPMGIHHAWGRSIKDIFIRYHAMQGCDCHSMRFTFPMFTNERNLDIIHFFQMWLLESL